MEIAGLVSQLIGTTFLLISMFFNFKKDNVNVALTWAYLSISFTSFAIYFY